MSNGPLSGINVIDLTHYIAGPYCTKLFADMGADVVKIENPETGDGVRWLSLFDNDDPNPEKNPIFLYLNTNKRSVTLDIRKKNGATTFKQLVQKADILVENFRPGVMAKLGLDYPVLERLNPRLVMVSISNFGQDGPYRDWLASELTLNALSGMMAMTGRIDREPLKLGLSQAQYTAGVTSAVAALAAYRQCRFSGYGQHVDISILESMLNMHHQQFAKYSYEGSKLLRESPDEFPYFFEAKDGWVHLSRLQVRQIVDFLSDFPELKDPKFKNPDNQREFAGIIAPWIRERSKFDIVQLAQFQGINAAAVHNEADLINSPQFAERGYLTDIDHPIAGKAKYPGKFFVSEQLEEPVPAPAPLLGQHTEEVIAGLRKGEGLCSVGQYRKVDEKTVKVGDDIKPLAGVRILSLEHWASLPHATKYLAGLGAEVIVVESPNRPREDSSYRFNIRGEPGRVGLYREAFRNKSTISLDLSEPKGVAIFKRLVKLCDAVVDNFTPRVMGNLGLGYEVLREVKQDIIVLSLSGFGHKGPWFLYRGYSITAESTSGLVNFMGYPDGPPYRPGGVPPGDVIPALHAAWALLMALEHKKRTGKGAFIDMSMIEPMTSQMGEAIVNYSMGGRAGFRTGNRDANACPSGCYPCKGKDKWITISVFSEGQWRALVELMGAPDWASSKSFLKRESRFKNQDALDKCISGWTCKFDNMRLMKACQRAGVPAGAVLTIPEVMTNEQLRQRGAFEIVQYPPEPEDIGSRLHIAPPWKLSRTPASTLRPAPLQHGQDNDSIYRGLLGLTPAELTELETEGIVSNRITSTRFRSGSVDDQVTTGWPLV
ncbi:MAG: CoA transferase, partial [Dehalococcoidales bacterium]|nr:CoA transferase [Dehalococcoidales bacterium]